MALYKTSNIGEYARMMREDALHALKGEVRTFDDEGRTMWEHGLDTDIDVAEEVDSVIKELSHHLYEALSAGRAMENEAMRAGVKFDHARLYGVELIKEMEKHDDEWSWIYEEEDGKL